MSYLKKDADKAEKSFEPYYDFIGSFTILVLCLSVVHPFIYERWPDQQYTWVISALSVFFSYWFIIRNASGYTKTSLMDNVFFNFKLTRKTQISPNTAIYRFILPSPDHILGLPIGQHVSISAKIDGKDVVRSYTPISSDDDKGFFELLIKSYPTGKISKYIDEIKIGEHVLVKGPKGQFKYSPNLCKSIGMISGGTGITPMLQIIKAILKNPEDKTKISFIFANVNEDDILCRKDLDLLAKDDRFDVYYVLNNPPKDWSGGVGFVTKDMIEKKLPGFSQDSKILLCGPPPMIKAMAGYLEDLGYPKPQTISKLQDSVFKF